MRRPTDIDPRTAAIDRLVRAGRAAMPDPSTIAEAHLGSMSVAIAAERARAGRAATMPTRRVVPRRRLVALGAMAAFIAVPSLAIAGVLPDPVQRVASNVAGAVGLDVPTPRSEHASSRADDRAASSSAGHTSNAEHGGSAGGKDSSTGPGATGDDHGHVNGAKPGKPEPGEQRGNRFGQVPGGPDNGKAGQPHGNPAKPAPPRHEPKPATPKPAKQPAPSTHAPATPAPATPDPSNGVGNGNGNAGGSNAGGNGNGHGNGHGH